MPQILSRPERNPHKPWINLKLTCRECGGSFQLQENDGVGGAVRVGDPYSIPCPICSLEVYFTMHGSVSSRDLRRDD